MHVDHFVLLPLHGSMMTCALHVHALTQPNAVCVHSNEVRGLQQRFNADDTKHKVADNSCSKEALSAIDHA